MLILLVIIIIIIAVIILFCVFTNNTTIVFLIYDNFGSNVGIYNRPVSACRANLNPGSAATGRARVQVDAPPGPADRARPGGRSTGPGGSRAARSTLCRSRRVASIRALNRIN